MASLRSKALIFILVFFSATSSQAGCFKSVGEIKANNIKRTWQETTESDGKPLIISLHDGANGLTFLAKKAGVLWLSGDVSACRVKGTTRISLRNTQATNEVPVLAKMGFPSTLSANIEGGKIQLAGDGWSGTFIGR